MRCSLFEHGIGIGPGYKINIRQEDIVCLGKFQGNIPQVINWIKVLKNNIEMISVHKVVITRNSSFIQIVYVLTIKRKLGKLKISKQLCL